MGLHIILSDISYEGEGDNEFLPWRCSGDREFVKEVWNCLDLVGIVEPQGYDNYYESQFSRPVSLKIFKDYLELWEYEDKSRYYLLLQIMLENKDFGIYLSY